MKTCVMKKEATVILWNDKNPYINKVVVIGDKKSIRGIRVNNLRPNRIKLGSVPYGFKLDDTLLDWFNCLKYSMDKDGVVFVDKCAKKIRLQEKEPNS